MYKTFTLSSLCELEASGAEYANSIPAGNALPRCPGRKKKEGKKRAHFNFSQTVCAQTQENSLLAGKTFLLIGLEKE